MAGIERLERVQVEGIAMSLHGLSEVLAGLAGSDVNVGCVTFDFLRESVDAIHDRAMEIAHG
ncbi:hypothetical protein HLV35_06085 [Eggerthellaceae bacterium zg-997]|nr:hypothetical protein [Eggerthellaceae bacterium zg-997]